MSEGPEQIRKHIDALGRFERDYREYIEALETDWGASVAAQAGVDEDGADWAPEEWARRKRKLQMDAVRADRAIKASGVGALIFTEAPAAGGGIRSADLPSQIFDFIEINSFGQDDGLTFQRKLLERMPSQIAGLEVQLEEAESVEKESTDRLFGEMVLDGVAAARERRPAPKQPREHPVGKPRQSKQPWHEHPWVVGIGVTVIGGGILAAIIAVVH